MDRNLIIITGAAMILLLSCSTEKQKGNAKTDVNEMGLQGKVKSLIEIEYLAEDKFGELIKGDIKAKTVYYFNESGNLIDEKLYEADGTLTKRETMFYDSNGHIIEYNQYYKNILESRETYNYDNAGNKVVVNYFDTDGNLTGKTINKFDNKGNEVKCNEYDSEGSLERIYTSNFDTKGNKIQEILYEPDGIVKRKTISRFDERGNEIETSHFNPDGNLDNKYNRKYDIQGNIIEINHHNSVGTLIGNVIYKYDGKGNEIECTDSWLSDGIKHIYISDYIKNDMDGNWIFQVHKYLRLSDTERKSQLTIIEREFEYF